MEIVPLERSNHYRWRRFDIFRFDSISKLNFRRVRRLQVRRTRLISAKKNKKKKLQNLASKLTNSLSPFSTSD